MTSVAGTSSCNSSSLFGPRLGVQRDHAGSVAARPIEAGDQPGLDRIAAAAEHDGTRRGRRLCHGAGGATDGDDHSDLTTNQIGRQCRQSVISALCPAVFNGHVPALDIAGFLQTVMEEGSEYCANASSEE